MAEPAEEGEVKQKNINAVASPLINIINRINMNKVKVPIAISGHITQKSMKTFQVGKYMLLIIFISILNLSCSTSEEFNKELNGKSIEKLIEKLGKPKSDKEFLLTKKLYEYQYGLLTYYPEPEGKQILIKEIIWETKQNKTVVWFHRINEKWESFDNLTWNYNKKIF